MAHTTRMSPITIHRYIHVHTSNTTRDICHIPHIFHIKHNSHACTTHNTCDMSRTHQMWCSYITCAIHTCHICSHALDVHITSDMAHFMDTHQTHHRCRHIHQKHIYTRLTTYATHLTQTYHTCIQVSNMYITHVTHQSATYHTCHNHMCEYTSPYVIQNTLVHTTKVHDTYIPHKCIHIIHTSSMLSPHTHHAHMSAHSSLRISCSWVGALLVLGLPLHPP